MATAQDPDSPSLACPAQNPAVLTAAACAAPLPNAPCSPASSPWTPPSPAGRDATSRSKRPGSSDAQSPSWPAVSTPIGEGPHVSTPQHGQPGFERQDQGRLGQSEHSVAGAIREPSRMSAGTETGIAVDNVSTVPCLDGAGPCAQPMPSEDMHAASDSASEEDEQSCRDVIMMMNTPSAVTLVEDVPRGSSFDLLPNEVLTHLLSFLDVCDLLATSRTNHHLRALSLDPLLHHLRLQHARASLAPLLCSPSRPTLRDLIARQIFLTHTTQISRRLARNLVAIRLSRRLPLRPSAETLVQRGVLPEECVEGTVAPGLVAKRRAVEREKLKDGLRRWVGGVWRGEVRERAEGVKKSEEKAGVGRVWRLKRFWERVGRGAGAGANTRDGLNPRG